MLIGMSAIGCSFIYTIIISILYFLKKKTKNFETNIYNVLLILALVNMFIELHLCVNVLLKVDSYSLYNMFLNRLFLITIFNWVTVFTVYIFKIAFSEKEKIIKNFNSKKMKILFIIFIIFIAVCLFKIITLRIDQFNDGVYSYSYGPATDFIVIIYGMYFFSWFIALIFRTNKKRFIKYLPLFIFIIISGLALFLRQINPGILLNSLPFSFAVLLMYFTIENPDLKLVEEIKLSKDKAEQLNTDKSNFIFNITQEMKKRIILMKSNITETLASNDVDVIKSNLHKLQSIVDDSNKMINQTLNISEEDIIKIEKIDNKYNVKNLIKETTLAAKNKIKESIDFRVSVENNIPEYLFGDSIKIKQILTTIIENSIKYTKKGFIELRVSSVIKYEICRLIITLEDSGIGIDQKIINNIFSKREDNDYISRNLNLNSVNKIINLIGGTFNINSKLNRGTKITITIDQHIPEEDTKNDQMAEYIKDLTIPKILLVDEDLNNLERIKKMFKNQNIFIDTVIMGEQCLRKVRNGEKFNLIIIDYEMPKLNGLQVFNKLKTEGYDIPVIITTDSDDVNIKKKYKEIGIYDVIKKPIKKKDIENIITYLKEN